MNNQQYQEIKEFFFEIIAYIRPNITINEYTTVGSLELDDIDFTMIAIECEEKYQIIVDEKIIANTFFLKEVIQYLINLIESKATTSYQILKH